MHTNQGVRKNFAQGPSSASISTKSRTYPADSLEQAILTVLKEQPLSPAAILSEVSQLKNVLVSQKRVGIAINELARAGLIRMVAPALYALVR